MKQIKTALVASAFVLASTLAFAQGGGPGVGGSPTPAELQTSDAVAASDNAAFAPSATHSRARTAEDVRARGSASVNKNNRQTTGSGNFDVDRRVK